MARRALVGFIVFFGFLVALGAFIATAVLGSTSDSRWVAVILAPLVVAFVVVLIVRYVRRTWLPIRDLMASADALADGDYTARVDARGSADRKSVV